MGDLTRQPETKLLTQAVVQLRLVVDGYFWTPVLADTESILFYINWPEELPETASKVIGLSGPCCSELLLTTVVLMMVKNAAWPTLEALNLNLEMCIRHVDFLDIACRRLISQQW